MRRHEDNSPTAYYRPSSKVADAVDPSLLHQCVSVFGRRCMWTCRRLAHFLDRSAAFGCLELEQLHSPLSRVSHIQAITKNPSTARLDRRIHPRNALAVRTPSNRGMSSHRHCRRDRFLIRFRGSCSDWSPCGIGKLRIALPS